MDFFPFEYTQIDIFHIEVGIIPIHLRPSELIDHVMLPSLSGCVYVGIILHRHDETTQRFLLTKCAASAWAVKTFELLKPRHYKLLYNKDQER